MLNVIDKMIIRQDIKAWKLILKELDKKMSNYQLIKMVIKAYKETKKELYNCSKV